MRLDDWQHRVVRLLRVEPGNQERGDCAHLLVGSTVAAVVVGGLPIHLGGRREVVSSHQVKRHLHAVQVSREPDDVGRLHVVHVGSWREQLTADNL